MARFSRRIYEWLEPGRILVFNSGAFRLPGADEGLAGRADVLVTSARKAIAPDRPGTLDSDQLATGRDDQ
ncbi:MAG: hypothetical protein R3A46_20965 [Thermomicrobiales bacterium]